MRKERTAIPAHVTHAVHRRDQGKCVWTDPVGKRCQNKRFTQLHHIKPLSHGGTHRVDNIATLCSAHHKAIHDGLVGFRLAI